MVPDQLPAYKYGYRTFRRRATVLVLCGGELWYRSRRKQRLVPVLRGAVGLIYGPCTSTFAHVRTPNPQLCFSLVHRERTFDFEARGPHGDAGELLLRLIRRACAAVDGGLRSVPGTLPGMVSRMQRMRRGLPSCPLAASARSWYRDLLRTFDDPAEPDGGLSEPDGGDPGLLLSEPTCAVCLDACGDGAVGLLVCGHVFHAACVQPWASAKGTCPLCRRRLDGS